MHLFEVSQFELPDPDKVDFEKTRHNVGLFLMEYKASRERAKLSALPKLTLTLDSIHFECEQLSSKNGSVETQNDFKRLSQIFIKGYTAIHHPFYPEVTARRRSIFMLRYLYGYSIPIISERVNYQRNVIIDDSKSSMIEFSHALGLIVLKSTNYQ